MGSMFRLLSAALFAIFFAVSNALAGSAEKEIRAFNDVEVKFTQNAAKCDFKSTEPFARRARKALLGVGLEENKNSIVNVFVEVGGINYGALETQCAISVNMQFRTILRSEDIATDNPDVRAALDRLEAFPIVLYEAGAFAVDTTLYTVADGRNITKAEARALDMLDRIAKRFDADRKR